MSVQDASILEQSGLRLHLLGEKGSPVVFVSGPPAGASMFEQVQVRLAPRKTVALEVVPSASGFSVEAFSRSLRAVCEAHCAQVLVVHGLALPLVLADLPPSIRLLILSNGPTRTLDPLSSVLVSLPRVFLEKCVLQPKFFVAWMASSLGFRRAVVNPYVMDKKTVTDLSRAFVGSAEERKMAAGWLKVLPTLLPIVLPDDTKVAAVWGDADPLYPSEQMLDKEGVECFLVSGGRFMHPKERPWELADACAELIEKTGL